ncbi:hypothetical protein Tco_0574560, partial [Tanacetum coccineum]
ILKLVAMILPNRGGSFLMKVFKMMKEFMKKQEGSGKASDEISTAGKKKDTASEEVPPVSTAGGTATYSRRS